RLANPAGARLPHARRVGKARSDLAVLAARYGHFHAAGGGRGSVCGPRRRDPFKRGSPAFHARRTHARTGGRLSQKGPGGPPMRAFFCPSVRRRLVPGLWARLYSKPLREQSHGALELQRVGGKI